MDTVADNPTLPSFVDNYYEPWNQANPGAEKIYESSDKNAVPSPQLSMPDNQCLIIPEPANTDKSNQSPKSAITDEHEKFVKNPLSDQQISDNFDKNSKVIEAAHEDIESILDKVIDIKPLSSPLPSSSSSASTSNNITTNNDNILSPLSPSSNLNILDGCADSDDKVNSINVFN
uniref:Uncharacterized protein n=1 Tax=Panagrolaimus superbus TaxID=310955 RepID=A0A914Y6U8_9BILA